MAQNTGVQAEFLPEGHQYPEFRQCVHKIARRPDRPEQLFMQNHGGVYRSREGGLSWDSVEAGLPNNFGFPVVVHPHEPDTVHVSRWEELGEGLPDVMVRAAAI